MSDYVLSCCSTADLTHDWLESRDIKYIFFNYYLNGEVCKLWRHELPRGALRQDARRCGGQDLADQRR